jgi:zinc protease
MSVRAELDEYQGGALFALQVTLPHAADVLEARMNAEVVFRLLANSPMPADLVVATLHAWDRVILAELASPPRLASLLTSMEHHPLTPPPLPAVARTAPRASSRVLDNGLKVVVVEHHARPVVSLRLLFASGAAADLDDRAGATYFMLSGLLATRDAKDALGDLKDPSEKSARRLVMELGAWLHFEVADDQASIGIDGFSRDLEPYLQHLYRVVKEARHGEETFSAHVAAVADQLDELEVTDGTALEQFLGQLAFGEGHPYARPVYGTPHSVSHLGVEDLVERQATLLLPAGSTLLVVGDVQPEQALQLASRAFSAWRRDGRASPGAVPPPAVRARAAVTFVPRKPARTTLVCATRPLTDVTAPDAPLALLTRVLGARLSAALREERGLTYSASATLLRLRGARALLACRQLDAMETTAALGVFLGTLDELARKAPSEDEVETARAVLISENDASADEVAGILGLWGRAIALREPISLPERAAALRAVELRQVQALSQKVVRRELFQVVISGERARVEPAVKALKLGALRTAHVSPAPED